MADMRPAGGLAPPDIPPNPPGAVLGVCTIHPREWTTRPHQRHAYTDQCHQWSPRSWGETAADPIEPVGTCSWHPHDTPVRPDEHHERTSQCKDWHPIDAGIYVGPGGRSIGEARERAWREVMETTLLILSDRPPIVEVTRGGHGCTWRWLWHGLVDNGSGGEQHYVGLTRCAVQRKIQRRGK